MKNSNLVVRIATSNNFNYSKNEIEDYSKLKEKFKYVFVNSNRNTNISNKHIPTIITINPNLTDYKPIIGYTDNVKAIRVKFAFSKKAIKANIKAIEYCSKLNIPILITFYRTKSKSNGKRYLDLLKLDKSKYSWINNYYRLNDIGKVKAIKIIENICKKFHCLHLLNYCDLKSKGCPSCKNCSKLACNVIRPIYEVNLKSSGYCKYNCIDCFAKNMQKYTGSIEFNVIKQNMKQLEIKSNLVKRINLSNLLQIKMS